jgi:tetratricopeptide (TPR) repeat protein
MAAQLIDEDAQLAHAHALAASRRAGRIAVVRETVAITAYALGDYALALRELRTYRRISGREDQIALMVDSERGVGRPDRAVELGRSVERAELPTVARVELAIAMSGARLDLGDAARALSELDIPELDPDRAFEWSPSLFQARATVLEELGRTDEAAEWHRRAVVAAEAIDDALGAGTDEEILVVEEFDEDEDEIAVDSNDIGSDDIGSDDIGSDDIDSDHVDTDDDVNVPAADDDGLVEDGDEGVREGDAEAAGDGASDADDSESDADESDADDSADDDSDDDPADDDSDELDPEEDATDERPAGATTPEADEDDARDDA